MKTLNQVAWAILAIVALGMVLWFTSPYFRAWMKYPVGMYRCTVTKKLPAEMCVWATQLGELARAGKGKP